MPEKLYNPPPENYVEKPVEESPPTPAAPTPPDPMSVQLAQQMLALMQQPSGSLPPPQHMPWGGIGAMAVMSRDPQKMATVVAPELAQRRNYQQDKYAWDQQNRQQKVRQMAVTQGAFQRAEAKQQQDDLLARADEQFKGTMENVGIEISGTKDSWFGVGGEGGQRAALLAQGLITENEANAADTLLGMVENIYGAMSSRKASDVNPADVQRVQQMISQFQTKIGEMASATQDDGPPMPAGMVKESAIAQGLISEINRFLPQLESGDVKTGFLEDIKVPWEKAATNPNSLYGQFVQSFTGWGERARKQVLAKGDMALMASMMMNKLSGAAISEPEMVRLQVFLPEFSKGNFANIADLKRLRRFLTANLAVIQERGKIIQGLMESTPGLDYETAKTHASGLVGLVESWDGDGGVVESLPMSNVPLPDWADDASQSFDLNAGTWKTSDFDRPTTPNPQRGIKWTPLAGVGSKEEVRRQVGRDRPPPSGLTVRQREAALRRQREARKKANE